MKQSSASSIGLDEFVEAATTAVIRAVDARKDDKGQPFPGTITLGIIADPDRERPVGTPQGSMKVGEGLTENELQALSTRMTINDESVRKVTDMLQKDYRGLGVKFANSLGQDFGRTMNRLFNLSSVDSEFVYAISRENSEELRYVSRVLATVLEYEDDLSLLLEFTPLPQPVAAQKEETKKQSSHEISIDFELDTEKKGKVTVKYTWKF